MEQNRARRLWSRCSLCLSVDRCGSYPGLFTVKGNFGDKIRREKARRNFDLSMNAIEISGVSAGYGGESVIKEIDLTVDSQELLAILGRSGSGKSTLVKTITGFIQPSCGKIFLNGVQVAGPEVFVPPELRNIGLVPQEGALFPHLSVAQNVEFGIRKEARKDLRVQELLDLVDLRELARARPQELSGGQQQRVSLARALARRPSVILLDEPFNALDATLRDHVRADIAEILSHTSTAAILVTHDQDEALSTAHAIALMDLGRILAFGSPQSLYQSPNSIPGAKLLGPINEIPGTVASENIADTEFGEMTFDTHELTEVGTRGTVLTRPESINFGNQGASALVESIRFHGHQALVTVITQSGLRLKVRDEQSVVSHIGDTVQLVFNGANTFIPASETSGRP